MQIFYYQRRDRQPNFGDELNSWLWRQLIPNYLNDADESTAFVGLGTLLNNALPRRLSGFQRAVLFTTGAGYERPLKRIPDNWRIYAVRGPRSAYRLGLPKDLAITDGGLLLRHCYIPHQTKRYQMSFMPHIHHANFAAPLFQQACDELGWGYIDPREPVETILTRIDQSGVLIAEAMHGAIAADALRVPWIPVITSPRVLPFKWQDWCESIGVTYHPYYLPPMSPYPKYARGMRSALKSGLHWMGCVKSGLWSPTLPNHDPNNHERIRQLVNRLVMLGQAPPQLSSLTTLNRLLDRLDQQLHCLCHDLDRNLTPLPIPANAEER